MSDAHILVLTVAFTYFVVGACLHATSTQGSRLSLVQLYVVSLVCILPGAVLAILSFLKVTNLIVLCIVILIPAIFIPSAMICALCKLKRRRQAKANNSVQYCDN